MQITCFSGFAKKPNSTKQPTGGITINVTLKEPTSVLEPVFIIQNYDLSWNYIRWGSRYYYVRDTVIVHNNIAEFHCQSDPWATFKGDIGSSVQFVSRSASQFNTYIQDGLYPAKSVTDVVTTELTSLSFTSVHGLGSYILGVLTDESSGGAVAYYSVGPGNFPSLMTKLFDPTYLNATDITTELQKELVNPMQYVVSCHWVPFTYDEGSFTTVKFGWWDSGVNAFLLGDTDRMYNTNQDFTLPTHPQQTRGKYLNDSPYTRHTLNCFTFGSIPLDPSPFADGKQGNISIDVDVFTGIGQLNVSCKVNNNNVRLFTAVAQVGIPVQLAQSNGNIIGSAIAGLEAVGSLVARNPLGATHGIMSAVSSAMPQVQRQGSTGTIVSYILNANIVTEFRSISNEDNTTMGRPLCEAKTISSLSGFIACENADFDTSASPSEKDEIINGMNTGFYYE